MSTYKHSAPASAHALETRAVIAGNVNLIRFSEAPARADLVGRHDADRGILVIQPATERPATGARRRWHSV